MRCTVGMDTVAYQGLGPAMAKEMAPDGRHGVLCRVQQLLCGWSREGHQMMLARDRRRLFLVCHRCLRETPGWQIDRR
jgi:hypothetical protein